ncbi:MAG: ABC transporter permease subunit [Acidimicrobiia bacterium]|nr:ABC transporter permease subunit [Acidimicrobiia bacterium]
MASSTIIDLSWYQRLRIRSLLAKSLADRRLMTLLIGVGIGGMSFLVASMFPALESTLADLDLGPAFEAIFGAGGMSTPEGWMSAEMYTLLVPGALVALVIIDAGRSIAGEMESLSIGLLASNPLSRTRILVDKAIAVVLHMVGCALTIGVFTWAGVVVIGLDMDATHVWGATIHTVGLGLMLSGAAVLFSVVIGRRVPAMIVVGSLAFVAYMVAVLFAVSEDLAGWAKISPWHYYWADNPLLAGVDWTDVAVMAAIGGLLFLLAVPVFNRKDLRA